MSPLPFLVTGAEPDPEAVVNAMRDRLAYLRDIALLHGRRRADGQARADFASALGFIEAHQGPAAVVDLLTAALDVVRRQPVGVPS